jgi:aminoglycoside 6'-N-acetyltransferase I
MHRSAGLRVRRAGPRDRDAWLAMRAALWPHAAGEHAREIDDFLAGRSAFIDETLVCEVEDGTLVGFVELRVRNYAEGSDRPAVPFVEGWYVDPAYRRRGVGALLIAHAEQWARSLGYSELGSDTEVDNTASIAAHRALGFEEMDRIVCFLKTL